MKDLSYSSALKLTTIYLIFIGLEVETKLRFSQPRERKKSLFKGVADSE